MPLASECFSRGERQQPGFAPRAMLRHPKPKAKGGAASKNRTCDPVITNDVLYL